MKGAIGNAFILNMVITFIIIFYMLLIGSMAYSQAYRTKNYLVNALEQYETNRRRQCKECEVTYNEDEWNNLVNEYLEQVGYVMSTEDSCPVRLNRDGYSFWRERRAGLNDYDYCVYKKLHINNDEISRYNYLVEIYMEFDFPVIGNFIRIPFRGETKTYTQIK